MRYYCHLDSPPSVDKTNLQLYSLQQAAGSWNELIDTLSDPTIEHNTERLAFILSCLGLSLSQLLGQNCPFPEKQKIDQPGVLLGALLKRASIDRTKRRHLNTTFKSFLTYYGAVRHFGKVESEANFRKDDQLTLEKLDQFRQMTIDIWDVVIAIFRKDKENELDEFRSISEVVEFDKIPDR